MARGRTDKQYWKPLNPSVVSATFGAEGLDDKHVEAFRKKHGYKFDASAKAITNRIGKFVRDTEVNRNIENYISSLKTGGMTDAQKWIYKGSDLHRQSEQRLKEQIRQAKDQRALRGNNTPPQISAQEQDGESSRWSQQDMLRFHSGESDPERRLNQYDVLKSGGAFEPGGGAKNIRWGRDKYTGAPKMIWGPGIPGYDRAHGPVSAATQTDRLEHQRQSNQRFLERVLRYKENSAERQQGMDVANRNDARLYIDAARSNMHSGTTVHPSLEGQTINGVVVTKDIIDRSQQEAFHDRKQYPGAIRSLVEGHNIKQGERAREARERGAEVLDQLARDRGDVTTREQAIQAAKDYLGPSGIQAARDHPGPSTPGERPPKVGPSVPSAAQNPVQDSVGGANNYIPFLGGQGVTLYPPSNQAERDRQNSALDETWRNLEALQNNIGGAGTPTAPGGAGTPTAPGGAGTTSSVQDAADPGPEFLEPPNLTGRTISQFVDQLSGIPQTPGNRESRQKLGRIPRYLLGKTGDREKVAQEVRREVDGFLERNPDIVEKARLLQDAAIQREKERLYAQGVHRTHGFSPIGKTVDEVMHEYAQRIVMYPNRHGYKYGKIDEDHINQRFLHEVIQVDDGGNIEARQPADLRESVPDWIKPSLNTPDQAPGQSSAAGFPPGDTSSGLPTSSPPTSRPQRQRRTVQQLREAEALINEEQEKAEAIEDAKKAEKDRWGSETDLDIRQKQQNILKDIHDLEESKRQVAVGDTERQLEHVSNLMESYHDLIRTVKPDDHGTISDKDQANRDIWIEELSRLLEMKRRLLGLPSATPPSVD